MENGILEEQYIWECEFNEEELPPTKYEKELSDIILGREMFYGVRKRLSNIMM